MNFTKEWSLKSGHLFVRLRGGGKFRLLNLEEDERERDTEPGNERQKLLGSDHD